MKIAVMPGDGIGPEVVAQALKVLRVVAPQAETQEAPIGEAGIQAHGVPLPESTLELARKADAILFGAVGVADEAAIPREHRPGTGLLQLRQALTLYANFRPAYMFPELIGASTLRPEVVNGLDIVIVRELNGDAYFGQPRGFEISQTGERVGFNTMRYAESEVERVAHAAFRAARRRHHKLCSVDKANVLEASQLWREVVTRVGQDYPDVELSHLFVDAAAMMLMRRPKQFDVIVTGNLFGDILSDAAAMLTGSIGMLPSASLGHDRKGLYEPVHGSAPDIAGKDMANPLAAILSLAMMLRESFEMEDDASRVEQAVRAVLAAGYRTADIQQDGTRCIGTRDMGDAVVEALRKQAA
ncbi:3-isopropylmalate dehydrogenase [Caballeronia arationis]|jgi:3-isopropylmalate dehydrogenase|uniref:3-isopropylmalate dehydrogenase n=1 Tax=Caballeronia arationis TaxID=1777142 RepID=A0A7Z7N0R8_9BURK|nr:3-isopropylmalate dehydrogenase [Caballeronia arationis]SAL01137.1 3-isopropylmalate dehydrogenase [Caballeronia arationis]SOE54181.1 3-isopropylmalate dehydrogenase [Caballeronia arationis]